MSRVSGRLWSIFYWFSRIIKVKPSLAGTDWPDYLKDVGKCRNQLCKIDLTHQSNRRYYPTLLSVSVSGRVIMWQSCNALVTWRGMRLCHAWQGWRWNSGSCSATTTVSTPTAAAVLATANTVRALVPPIHVEWWSQWLELERDTVMSCSVSPQRLTPFPLLYSVSGESRRGWTGLWASGPSRKCFRVSWTVTLWCWFSSVEI